MKCRLNALTCALSCLVPLPVLADTPTVVSDITTLDTMVVTGSKEAQAAGDTPAAISKVGAERIDAQKATVISEVLNTVPGVYMPQFGRATP